MGVELSSEQTFSISGHDGQNGGLWKANGQMVMFSGQKLSHSHLLLKSLPFVLNGKKYYGHWFTECCIWGGFDHLYLTTCYCRKKRGVTNTTFCFKGPTKRVGHLSSTTPYWRCSWPLHSYARLPGICLIIIDLIHWLISSLQTWQQPKIKEEEKLNTEKGHLCKSKYIILTLHVSEARMPSQFYFDIFPAFLGNKFHHCICSRSN